MEFSQGYNPQPKISFAQPLPLGIEGEREYGEFKLAGGGYEDTDLLIKRINSKLVKGFELKKVKKIETPSPPSLMSIVHASLYEADFSLLLTKDELKTTVSKINTAEELLITTRKKGKKKKKGKGKKEEGYKFKNVIEYIYNLEDDGKTLKALIKTGSQGNLRPDELTRGVMSIARGKESDKDFEDVDTTRVKFRRKELYYQDFKGNSAGEENELKPIWNY